MILRASEFQTSAIRSTRRTSSHSSRLSPTARTTVRRRCAELAVAAERRGGDGENRTRAVQ